MSKQETVELTSKGTWSAMKKVKNSEIRHLKVSTGGDTTLLDTPTNFNFRIIPRVFTAPLQAVGLVASIFARMTNTKISLGLENEED